MQVEQTHIDDDILKISLSGSLDIQGASEIELPFSVAAGKHEKIIVDLAGVDFLASIGIRVLVKTAKALAQRGGKLALLKPNETVLKVLKSTGIDGLLAIVDEEAIAIEAVS